MCIVLVISVPVYSTCTAFHSTYQAQQRHWQALIAIVKQPLVEQCEQCIQYGAVGLEDLVNEGHLSCWQVPINFTDILVILKSCKTPCPVLGSARPYLTQACPSQ
jgi:hypothetical protein